MSVKAYPCIGGPLDGKHAVTADFYREFGKPEYRYWNPAGMYSHLSDQYHAYNNAGTSKFASMVFIHVSLLKQSIKPSER